MLLHAILLLQQGETLAPDGPLSWLPGAPAEKTMVISGRLQSDWTFTAGGEDTEAALGEEIMDGHEFRRLRLGGQTRQDHRHEHDGRRQPAIDHRVLHSQSHSRERRNRITAVPAVRGALERLKT